MFLLSPVGVFIRSDYAFKMHQLLPSLLFALLGLSSIISLSYRSPFGHFFGGNIGVPISHIFHRGSHRDGAVCRCRPEDG